MTIQFTRCGSTSECFWGNSLSVAREHSIFPLAFYVTQRRFSSFRRLLFHTSFEFCWHPCGPAPEQLRDLPSPDVAERVHQFSFASLLILTFITASSTLLHLRLLCYFAISFVSIRSKIETSFLNVQLLKILYIFV